MNTIMTIRGFVPVAALGGMLAFGAAMPAQAQSSVIPESDKGALGDQERRVPDGMRTQRGGEIRTPAPESDVGALGEQERRVRDGMRVQRRYGGPMRNRQDCREQAMEQAEERGLQPGDMRSFTMRHSRSGNAPEYVVGYNAWMKPQGCQEGWYVVNMNRQCQVIEDWTDGPCEVPDVPKF